LKHGVLVVAVVVVLVMGLVGREMAALLEQGEPTHIVYLELLSLALQKQ
jgi:hypothetical protein